MEELNNMPLIFIYAQNSVCVCVCVCVCVQKIIMHILTNEGSPIQALTDDEFKLEWEKY